MKVTSIHSGLFKLDGGAMFGVVPQQLWKHHNEPDENNMCTWAMRCLLVETDSRKILLDTGMGNKQDEKFRSHFEPHGPYSLLNSLSNIHIRADEITDVFLTHLHFDHCGGAVHLDQLGTLSPTFPNAKYWSNRAHWEWARNPNPREKASFLKENFVPLEEEGMVHFIPTDDFITSWIDGINILHVDGHTEKMMIPHIRMGNKTIVFCADLLPSAGHLGLPYVMSYDIRPLETLKEKKSFLDKAVEEEYILFLEHDKDQECIQVGLNEKGRYTIRQRGNLSDFIGE